MQQPSRFIGLVLPVAAMFAAACADTATAPVPGGGFDSASLLLNAGLAHADHATGDPIADGWVFGGRSLDAGVFVQGAGDFTYDIYTAAFALGQNSPLVGGDWQAGHTILGIGGVIDFDAANPNHTHSVRIVSKFGTSEDAWSPAPSPQGSFSGGHGGNGSLLLATRPPLSPSGNTEHLNPFPSGSRAASALGPGEIHPIPILQRLQNGSVNSGHGTEAGKFIYLRGGDDFADTFTGSLAPRLASWQVFLNVSLLDDAFPVPEAGHRAIQTLQRSTGVFTDGLATIQPLASQDPQTRADCMNGGWAAYGFRNQGLCIQFVNTGEDSR